MSKVEYLAGNAGAGAGAGGDGDGDDDDKLNAQGRDSTRGTVSSQFMHLLQLLPF